MSRLHPCLHPPCDLELGLKRLVTLRVLLQTRKSPLHRAEIGEHEFRADRLHIRERIDTPIHVCDVHIREEPHDLADGVSLPDVREELVAQAFALARTLDEPGDVNELDSRGYDTLWMDQLGETLETRVGNRNDAHVRLDGGKRVVGRVDDLTRQGGEQGRLAHVRQADDSDRK